MSWLRFSLREIFLVTLLVALLLALVTQTYLRPWPPSKGRAVVERRPEGGARRAGGERGWPEGAQGVSGHVSGTGWKLRVKEVQRVTAGRPVVIVESMKMEFAVEAPVNGTVRQLFCKGGAHVSAGQILLVIQED